MALLGDDDVGIFISVGGFKSTAEREARTQERRRMLIAGGAVDRSELERAGP